MSDPFVYIPAAIYLACLSTCLLARWRFPAWAHPVAALAVLPFRIWNEGPLSALGSFAASAAVFLFLLVVASRLLSKTGLFSVTVTLAMLPFAGWIAVGAGLVAAAVAGTVRTARVLGRGRITMLTNETFAAMGVGMAGNFHRPDLDRLPTREDTDLAAGDEGTSQRLRLLLPPYLLGGVLVGAAVSWALTS